MSSLTPTKRKADSTELAYIHKVTPKKRSSRSEWFDVYIQTESEDQKMIRSFNASSFNDFDCFARSKSPVKMSTKMWNGTTVFNESCRINRVNSQDMPFQYKEANIDDVQHQESKFLAIGSIKTMTPNQGIPITVEATVLIGNAEYEEVTKVSSKVKTDCFVQDETGWFPCHFWESTAKLLISTKTYRLTNLFLRSFKGENYLASSRYTEVTEIKQKIKEINRDLISESVIVALHIDDFSSVRNICKYYSCLSCKRKIVKCNKESTIACPHCAALNKVKKLNLDVSMEVQFTHQNEDLWATMFKGTIEKYIDVTGTIEDIGEKVLEMENIDIMLDSKQNIITSVEKRKPLTEVQDQEIGEIL